ncbi:hypothetical protein, partial [Micromonospora sp. 4G55]|uniref:SpnB-like Rossmann fold domain-containing protein n=1 Tax=Micromonospora sp. 4G55 TaxID=2806102 RepID=UPI001A58B3FA
MRAWLADDRFADSRLVLLTREAVVTGSDDRVALDQAPVWGLVRAAQAENPERFVLADTDGRLRRPGGAGPGAGLGPGPGGAGGEPGTVRPRR